MSIQYVIARPCKECMEKEEEEYGLSYLMEEEGQGDKGITKVFNSHKEAKKWLKHNIHAEDHEETMIIPLSEVPEWDGEKL
jgi:hypothetical protein